MHLSDGSLNNQITGLFTGASVAVSLFIGKRVFSKVLKRAPSKKMALASSPSYGSTFSTSKTELTDLGKEKIFRILSVSSLLLIIQFFDFPVLFGLSEHLLGGMMALLILGPLESFVAMSITIIFQSLFLKDGGIILLGVNIFNMGIIGTLGAFYAYKQFSILIKKRSIKIMLATLISYSLAIVLSILEPTFFGLADQKPHLSINIFSLLLLGLTEGVFALVIIELLKKNNVPLWGDR